MKCVKPVNAMYILLAMDILSKKQIGHVNKVVDLYIHTYIHIYIIYIYIYTLHIYIYILYIYIFVYIYTYGVYDPLIIRWI